MKKAAFRQLLRSIDEVRAIHAGRRKPARVTRFHPLQVKTIRRKLHTSQVQFAHLIGVSPATLRNWEQGRTYPEGAARALLQVAAKQPAAVLNALRA